MPIGEAGKYAGQVAIENGFKNYSLGFGMTGEMTNDKGEVIPSDLEAGTVTIIIKEER